MFQSRNAFPKNICEFFSNTTPTLIDKLPFRSISLELIENLKPESIEFVFPSLTKGEKKNMSAQRENATFATFLFVFLRLRCSIDLSERQYIVTTRRYCKAFENLCLERRWRCETTDSANLATNIQSKMRESIL